MDKCKIIGVILNTNEGERGEGRKSIPPELSFEIGIGIGIAIGIEKQNPVACDQAPDLELFDSLLMETTTPANKNLHHNSLIQK